MKPRKINHARLRPTLQGAARACSVLLAALCVSVTAVAQQTTEFVELMSINSAAIGSGNNTSSEPRSSDGGRFVVFESAASDLVANDANGAADIFVRDRQTGTTSLVSVNAAGNASGNGESRRPSITPNGRYVLLSSRATNLVSAAVTGAQHLYVRDLVAQTTAVVDADSNGVVSPTASATNGVITPDGRYVAFLISNSVYWRDLQTNSLKLLDSGACGSSNCFSLTPLSITPDGRYVAFTTNRALVPNDTNGPNGADVYRRDTQTDTTVLVSVNKDGIAPMTSSRSSFFASMSDDGQVIAFLSSSFDIVPDDDPSRNFTSPSVYARNLATNTTTLVSQRQFREGTTPTIPAASQPRISADGRYVFYLRVENFVTGLAASGFRDRIFRRDLQTGDLLELPFVATGNCDEGFDCRSIVEAFVTSPDGRYVAYRQFERPRVNSSPFSTAIVVRDMVGGGTEIVNGFPGVSSETNGDVPLILTPGNVTNDGKLAFSSGIGHAPHDTNGLEDVYLFAPPSVNRLSFNRSSYFAAESGSVGILGGARVRRAGYLIDSTVTVRFETSGGTAGAGSDYAARSETLTFGPGETEKTFNIQVFNDELIDPGETVTLTLSAPTGNAILGTPSVATLSIEDDDPHLFLFSASDYEVSEASLSLVVTVNVTGAPTVPVSVSYFTSDGTASERSDYGTARGRLTFAPGETSKSFRLLIVNDVFVEGDETVNLTLSDPKGGFVTNGGIGSSAVVRITSDDSVAPTSNPIDASGFSEFFVRQHYYDFLNRLPDARGLPFWTNEIESCGADAQCREVKRVNVSAAFFLSIEFQTTGYLAYLTNKTAFGTRPLYTHFMHDVQTLQRDFVFGEPDAPARLEANKRAYFDEFVTRTAFIARYAGMNNAEYVSALLNDNGLSPTLGNLFVSRLDAAQVVPQSGSGATGVVVLRRDPAGNSPGTTVSLALRNLTGQPTAVHIHGPAAQGSNAPEVIALPAGEFADFRLALSGEQINWLNTGQLYIDVHTQSFPDGEIRARLGPTLFRGDVLTSALDNQILTRAQVLRAVAEFDELKAAELNRAFVLMEYFGYLRRDPDEDGYNFWLSKLNEFGGDYVRAEMVKAFINSAEYRQRFGP